MAMESQSTKLAGFNLIQTNYKHVGGHGIRADFLVPKTIPPGKRPVIVRFHGGGLINGDSLFLEWLPQWLLDLAEKHGAVIASPNYRLMPESTSLDVFDDLEDFWTWLRSPSVSDLLSSQANPVEIDLTRILLAGESAGGLLSIVFALVHADEVRAATAAYPCADMTASHFRTPKSAPLMDMPVPESRIEDHLASMKEDAIVSSAFPPDRLDLLCGAIQHGSFTALYDRGTEKSPRRELRYPMERLDLADVKIPRGGIAIIHGLQDDVVPPEISKDFVAKARGVMKGKSGGDKICLSLQEGGHGFDGLIRLDQAWLQECIKEAVETWLEYY